MKLLLIVAIALVVLSCTQSTEIDTNQEWVSVCGFPSQVYIGNFDGFTEIDQHYNITSIDSTDWQIVEIDSNRVINRWLDIEYNFRMASSNPSREPIFNFNNAEQSYVTLIITNNRGELVKTLLNRLISIGRHIIVYNGVDENNNRINPGLFRIHLHISDEMGFNYYSFGDFYLESEFKWEYINEEAKDFVDIHFSRGLQEYYYYNRFIESYYEYNSNYYMSFSFFWDNYTLPEENNHRFYENIALLDHNIFGWDDWQWQFAYNDSIVWRFETIDDFIVWKGNEVTNPESDDFGIILDPYSQNRENYMQLINE